MNNSIRVEDLDEATREKIGLPSKSGEAPISDRLVSLGRVLATLKGLSRNDGIWLLSQALYAIQKEAIETEIGHAEVIEEDMPVSFVLYLVARGFELQVPDLLDRSRIPEFVVARQTAMYILWNSERYTLTQIGNVLGGRSAATVSHGYQQIAKRVRVDGRLRHKIETINVEIGKGVVSQADYLLMKSNGGGN